MSSGGIVKNLLEVKNLRVRFPVSGGVFSRKVAEIRAVVNILRHMSYGVEVSGQVLYNYEKGAVDLASLNRHQMRPYRTDLQMIFQDPYSSLNPRMTVMQIIEE